MVGHFFKCQCYTVLFYTVSAGIQELIDAIVSLELTAADLMENASLYFNVESGGVTYTINDTSLTIDGIVDCPVGSVSDDGICGE